MKRLSYISMIILLSSLILSSYKNNDRPKIKNKWIQLFNGKNLDGWVVKIKGHPLGDNYKNTFRVVNGVMQVNYDQYNDTFNGSFGHIFYKKEFSNYILKLQYRFTGKQIKDGDGWAKRNSGIMIHCQSPESMELEQNFPVSIEVQLLGGLDNGDRPTGNLCTPGTHVMMDDKLITKHCVNSSSKTYNGDQWVRVEVIVRNDSIISHKINGKTVLTYNKPQIGGTVENVDKKVWKSRQGTALKKGYISLQSESHPVEFKNIEILELH